MMAAYMTILRSATLGGNSFLTLFISRSFLVLVGSVLITRRALGEQRRRAESVVPTQSAFDDDVDTIGEGIGSDASVDDVVGLRAVGHSERDFSSARIAHDRPT